MTLSIQATIDAHRERALQKYIEKTVVLLRGIRDAIEGIKPFAKDSHLTFEAQQRHAATLIAKLEKLLEEVT